jgi:hypothetical protein
MLINTIKSTIKIRIPIPPKVKIRKVLFDFLIEYAYAQIKRRKFNVEIAIPKRIE